MVWKPKERELTREEAIEAARKLLAPNWYHASPLFMAGPSPEGIKIFPLDEVFSRGRWLIALLDPFTPSGTLALRHLKVLHARHIPHELGTIVICRSPHEYARERLVMESMFERKGIRFPVCLDPDGNLHAGFGASDPGGIHFRIYDKGVCVGSRTEAGISVAVEREAQQFLRQGDIGLALRPLLADQGVRLIDERKLDLARDAGSGGAGFRSIGESWRVEGGRRLACGPDCALELEVAPVELHLLAGIAARAGPLQRVRVSVEGAPVLPEIRGESLNEEDDGQTCASIRHARVVQLLLGEESPGAATRRVRLEFPNASAENPFAVQTLFQVCGV